MRIVGIDPGLRKTGFGVIDAISGQLRWVASGTIVVPPELPLAQRLQVIYTHIGEIIALHHPEVAAIEKVFVNMNPQSTLLLGQARGAALCALAQYDLEVTEYTALQIKKAVVGQGHAVKQQVQQMVRYLLQLEGNPAPDAADALACAICHAHTAPLAQQIQQARMKHGRFIG